jgi:Ca2+-binding EF-hand superfamily protein
MKYRKLFIATVGATAGLALLALPAAAAGPGARGASIIETFDTDGDGNLKQAEVDQFRTDRLAEFDSNGDGNLTLEEYQALWLDAMRERMVDAFQRLDDDGDALVTREEFVEPFAKLVQRLDRDNDGTVTQDEMRSQREQVRERHHGARPDGSGPPRRLPR